MRYAVILIKDVKMAAVSSCRVHPLVLFNIVDAYERRKEDAKRVIGTLLGDLFFFCENIIFIIRARLLNDNKVLIC